MMRIAATCSSQFPLLARRCLRINRSSRVRIPNGKNASSTAVGLNPLLDQRRDWKGDGQLHMKSNHSTMACVLPFDDDQRQRHPQSSQLQQLQQKRRKYHSTSRQPILPLIVGCVAVAGGYVVYRTLQGASVVPDEATKAQEAYRKQQGKFSNTTTSSTATGTSSFSSSRKNKATTATGESSSSQQETKTSKDEESKVNR